MYKSNAKNSPTRRQKLAPGPARPKPRRTTGQKELVRKGKHQAMSEDDLWTLYQRARVRGKALSFSSCCGAICIRGDKADITHPEHSRVPLWTLIGKDPCPDAESLDRRLDQAFDMIQFGFPYILVGENHLQGKYDRLYYKRTTEKEELMRRITELEETVRDLTQRLNLELAQDQPTTQGTMRPIQNEENQPDEPIRRSFLSQ